MEVLIIFENDFNCDRILEKFKNKQVTINLFPLTSNYLIIDRVHQQFSEVSNIKINSIKSAKLINQEVINMQKNKFY